MEKATITVASATATEICRYLDALADPDRPSYRVDAGDRRSDPVVPQDPTDLLKALVDPTTRTYRTIPILGGGEISTLPLSPHSPIRFVYSPGSDADHLVGQAPYELVGLLNQLAETGYWDHQDPDPETRDHQDPDPETRDHQDPDPETAPPNRAPDGATYNVEVRSVPARRGLSGWSGPDTAVYLVRVPAGVECPYTLRQDWLDKRGIKIALVGEGYSRSSLTGTRSRLGRAFRLAHALRRSLVTGKLTWDEALASIPRRI